MFMGGGFHGDEPHARLFEKAKHPGWTQFLDVAVSSRLAILTKLTCVRPSQARPDTERAASARERRPNIATGLRSAASVAESKGGLPIVEFADQTAWESWLQRNHQCQDGVWMKLAKKAAPVKTQTHAAALEAALCYG